MYSCEGTQCPLAYHCKRKERFDDDRLCDKAVNTDWDNDRKFCENYISIKDTVCAECQYYHDDYCDYHEEAGVDDDSLACSHFEEKGFD